MWLHFIYVFYLFGPVMRHPVSSSADSRPSFPSSSSCTSSSATCLMSGSVDTQRSQDGLLDDEAAGTAGGSLNCPRPAIGLLYDDSTDMAQDMEIGRTITVSGKTGAQDECKLQQASSSSCSTGHLTTTTVQLTPPGVPSYHLENHRQTSAPRTPNTNIHAGIEDDSTMVQDMEIGRTIAVSGKQGAHDGGILRHASSTACSTGRSTTTTMQPTPHRTSPYHLENHIQTSGPGTPNTTAHPGFEDDRAPTPPVPNMIDMELDELTGDTHGHPAQDAGRPASSSNESIPSTKESSLPNGTSNCSSEHNHMNIDDLYDDPLAILLHRVARVLNEALINGDSLWWT